MKLMGKFREDLNNEREDTPAVIEWVSKILRLSNVHNVSERIQKERDIDFHGSTKKQTHTFENKIRYKEYDDVLIETISNMNKLSPGWIYASEADYLNYVFLDNGIVKKGYIFDLPKLQEWWNRYGKNVKYQIHYGKTSDLYKTQNVAVPEKHIPLSCVIYHPIYGLLRTINGELDESYFR